MRNKEETLRLLSKGDRSVIAELYDSIFPKIKRYILNNSGGLSDAEDTFQEALVVIFRKLKEGNLSLTCSLTTYIYSICRNIWLDRLRRTKKFTALSAHEEEYVELGEDTIETIHQNERNNLFQKHFLKMKKDCQEVLKLFMEGVSMKQISIDMGYGNEEYARKKKYMCKKNLVNNIKKDPLFSELEDDNRETNTIK